MFPYVTGAKSPALPFLQYAAACAEEAPKEPTGRGHRAGGTIFVPVSIFIKDVTTPVRVYECVTHA